MKNIFFAIGVALFMLVANLVNAAGTLSGNSLTQLGEYQITPSTSSVVVDNVAFKTWELSYSGSSEKYTLFLVPGDDGDCCYTVRGDGFEIRYTVAADKFGARLVDSPYRTVSKKELMKKVNKMQLQSQEVISTSPKTEEEYLGIIACFMPLLMN